MNSLTFAAKHPILKGFNKDFFKTLYTIALPIILQNFVNSFINMLDTVMVGKLGEVSIAAVGLGNQIFFLLNLMVFGTVSGGAIFVAQFWGKKDMKGIRKSTGLMMLISLLISCVFMIASLIAPDFLISLYSKDIAVIQEGGKYLRLASISYPILAIGFVLAQTCRSTEEVRIPMVSTIISLLTNLVFNFILIFGVKFGNNVIIPAFGVVGAAIATIISRIVQLTVMLGMIKRKKLEFAKDFKDFFSFNSQFVFHFIKITLPVIINETIWSFGVTLQNRIFAQVGTEAIAAFNITGTISQLTWVFMMGTGNAAAILIGKSIGANNKEDAYNLAVRIALLMVGMAAIVGLLLIPLSFVLPVFFNVKPFILQQAQYMLFSLVAMYPFRSFNMTMIVGVCRSGGDTIFSAIADTAFMYCIALPLASVAAFVWHLAPWILFVCLGIEDVFKTAVLSWRLFSKKWLHNVVS